MIHAMHNYPLIRFIKASSPLNYNCWSLLNPSRAKKKGDFLYDIVEFCCILRATCICAIRGDSSLAYVCAGSLVMRYLWYVPFVVKTVWHMSTPVITSMPTNSITLNSIMLTKSLFKMLCQ
jgi:hypothetical protein